MILCITIEVAGQQFASVLNGQVVNASRYKDYSLFHWKAYDVKALKTPIDKFVFLDALGALFEVIEAPQLKTRGVNYATAKRSPLELTDDEAVQVAHALELVQSGHVASQAKATALTEDWAAGDDPNTADRDEALGDGNVDSEGDQGAGNPTTEEPTGDQPADPAGDAAARDRAKKRKRR
jgi:hypothetical protein